MSRTTMPRSMCMRTFPLVAVSDELLDLASVEVLVRPADHSVAYVADEAHLHVPHEAVGSGHVDRVLLHEAAFEHPHPAILEARLRERLHALLQHREVVGARLVAAVV